MEIFLNRNIFRRNICRGNKFVKTCVTSNVRQGKSMVTTVVSQFQF